MLKVGITGGIGSGKTTVSKIFSVLGIPVFYADEESKKIIATNLEVKQQLIQEFGTEVFVGDKLNKTYLANLVFNDKYQLEKLNAITHPIVIAEGWKWAAKQTAPYIIKEAALIFESGSAEGLDIVIGVYSPKHLRIKRVMDRDNITREEVLNRMSKQLDEEMKMKLCDFIINNNEEDLLITQVLSLHNLFLKGIF